MNNTRYIACKDEVEVVKEAAAADGTGMSVSAE